MNYIYSPFKLAKSPNSVGIVPVNFCCMRILFFFSGLKIWRFKWIWEKNIEKIKIYRTCKWVNNPSSVGIVPVNSFEPSKECLLSKNEREKKRVSSLLVIGHKSDLAIIVSFEWNFKIESILHDNSVFFSLLQKIIYQKKREREREGEKRKDLQIS